MTGLAFSTTVTRDFIVANEIRKSTLVDRIFISEFNRTTRREDIDFFELGTGSTVLVNSTTAIEWSSTIAPVVFVAPIEYRSEILRTIPISVEWRGIATLNTTAPLEWGLSARNDVVAPIDFNMSRSASPVVPTEWGSLTLFRDVVMPLEFVTTAALGWPVSVEWQSRIFEVTPTPIDWSTPFLRDYAVPLEAPSSARSDAAIPIDFSQPAQMTTSFTAPLEFVNQISVTYNEPTTIDQVRVRDTTVFAEWTGNTGVVLDATAPLEWRSVFTTDAITSIEWRRAMTLDAPSITEWGFVLNTTPVVAVEFSSIILGSFIVPSSNAGTTAEDMIVSSGVGASPFRDVVAPLAISGSSTGATGDATSPMAFGGGFGSPLYPTQIDFNATAQRNVTMLTDWLSMMLSEPETVAESTLSVVGESFIVPDTNFDLITADYETPLEWSAIGISVSETFEVEHVGNTVGDFSAPVDWYGTSLSADTISLIDWTQDTAVVIGDAEIPVDWTMPVLVDVRVDEERWFDRDSIGSSLEPDKWEEEHG